MITRYDAESLSDKVFHVRICDVDVVDFGKEAGINIKFLDGPLQDEIVKFDMRITNVTTTENIGD